MSSDNSTLFNAFEIGNSLSKDQYKSRVPQLRVDLVNSQDQLKANEKSILILLTGNDRKSVNEALDVLHEWMDVRYLHTQVFLPRNKYEREFPAYWRFWQNLPPAGHIGCFLGAWTMQALRERLTQKGSNDTLSRRIRHIQALESTLLNNDVQVLKFWLHVPKDEVKKQLKIAKKHPKENPYIRQEDWEVYEKYDEILPVAERLVKETSTPEAPWHIIESTDPYYRNIKLGEHILNQLQTVLGNTQTVPDNASPPLENSICEAGPLDTVNLKQTIPKETYKKTLANLQSELNQLIIQARDHFATVIVFEGWDAAGKGGVIRRITKALFAEDYRVVPIAAPSEHEKKYHYLRRFWTQLPRQGRVTIFDRSWYGRVLVERVEGFATQQQWERGFYEINDFEDQLVSHKINLLKFWLHIDPDEQLRRFQERELLPYKNHKITEEDYRNRNKWPAYLQAANDMIAKTSTSTAPWHLIPANDKRFARITTLQLIVNSLKSKLDVLESAQEH